MRSPIDETGSVAPPTRVLFVEASSGGVVGGSLSGLYHLIRGMDREHFRVGMALYEAKGIESDLARLGVAVHSVRRRRLEKEHALLRYNGYHRAKSVGPIRSGLAAGRHAARLSFEEIPTALALARIIRRERIDVVHLGNGVRANFDGILAALVTRTPIVCHVKGFEKYGARERWASRRVDVVVCMTQAILAYCRAHGLTPPQARVVYDAVDEAWLDVGRPAAEIRAELGVPNGGAAIGLLGNIQEWKGQHVLVEAMASVARAHPGARCLIIGGVHRAGERYAADLRARCAELGLADSVRFVGFRDDVPNVINALDVVVHASVRPEPFGRVILEGMLMGKPVVATDAGGVPELIEHGRTGFLVPPGDAAAMAACLTAIVARPEEAAAVGERARTWARQRFSLARQVAEMSEIYRSLAERRRGARVTS
jgi:glycosyltransferase involved in cell wall biosynthesis